MRHKATFHPEKIHDMDESDNESMDEATDEVTSNEGSDRGSDEGSEEGSEHEDVSERYNLWTYLKDLAFKQDKIDEKYQETSEALIRDGVSEEEAKKRALHASLPDVRNAIYKSYTDLLLLWHYAEEDDSHQKIIATKQKLMDEEDYDEDEAILYAVKKRAYLIQKETKTRDDDFVSLDQIEDDADEIELNEEL